VLPKLAVAVALVRAGSVRQRKPLALDGHERSGPANQNRRSQAVHRFDLGRPRSLGPGSNPAASATKSSRHRTATSRVLLVLSGPTHAVVQVRHPIPLNDLWVLQ
jgi:hypothetical protein